MAAKVRNSQQINNDSAEREYTNLQCPTSSEVIKSIERNYEVIVKPALIEWAKDIMIVRYGAFI